MAAGDRIAIAISGGPDSVALLWLLREIDSARELNGAIVGLIHVNHGLRGEESARDEAFCGALAQRLGWPLEIGRFDVAACARATGRSLEASGRAVRYQFFAEAAGRLGATVVATGHTLDDQAETVLLRLLRGAGARGVAGIRRRRGPFIRPVLDCRRADLRQYLIDRGEASCEDSSNQDQAYARNRVRRQLLPVIEQVAPGSVAALARFAALSADDEAFLQRTAIELAASVVLSSGAGVQLDAGTLSELPPALGRRVARLALEQAAPGVDFGFGHLASVLALAAADRPRGHVDLPALKVRRRGPTLFLGGPTAPQGVQFERSLTIPGLVEIPEAGLTIAASVRDDGSLGDLGTGRGDLATVQAASVAAPLVVRSRRPGDRLRPLGAPGHRKLQDLLVDRKVPREMRDRVPIVVDSVGRIVWVVGLTIAEECRVTTPATGMVVLKVQRNS